MEAEVGCLVGTSAVGWFARTSKEARRACVKGRASRSDEDALVGSRRAEEGEFGGNQGAAERQ